MSIHPKYGGWFAFRGVLIFPDIHPPPASLVQPDMPDVIPNDAALRELLEQFNYHWRDGRYRDCVPVAERYSEEQQEYPLVPTLL